MEEIIKKELVAYLQEFITPAKKEKIEAVLAYRTRRVTLLLEDIYQSHNANAIIRSADCFGLQDIHVVETHNKFSKDMGISRGATQWVDIHRYKTSQSAITTLKKQNYRIYAASPDATQTISHVSVSDKIAFLFGTEKEGISDFARENADDIIKIPMFGFTQSFNVSVSAALCLQDCITRLHSLNDSWHLSEQEKLDIKLQWLRLIIEASRLLEEKFLKERE
jgi:tRNA (guanosine-2'-O-)-methyltransferase